MKTVAAASAMPDCARASQPRSSGTVLAALFSALPESLEEAASAVRLDAASLMALGGGAWQGELAVPSGFWRLWPRRGLAAWFGHRTDRPLDRPPADLAPVELDLVSAVRRLRARGFWPTELSLLCADGWTSALPAHEAMLELAKSSSSWEALAGTWSDGVGGGMYVEFDRTGRAWAHDRHDAERLLLAATGLDSE